MNKHNKFPKNENEDELEDVKSRTQIKREMEGLQAIGKKLCECKESILKEVPLSDELDDAISTYKRISSREAKRRQLQYIGKLMRSEPIEDIQLILDKHDASSQVFAQHLHQIEAWRDRLINDGKSALTDFVDAHSNVEVQQLRQLTRNAIKDKDNSKNTGAAKKLFQFIKKAAD
jgi:ribosome-associated protein